MIATFSPPVKGTADHDSLPRIIVAVSDSSELLCVDGDGRFEWIPVQGITMDWRYDPRTEIWDDVGSRVAGSEDDI